MIAFAAVFGLAFGALDQYLGSVWGLTTLGPWATSLSGMSAPWLALPFAFGATARSRRRAALIGAVVTAGALLGYFAMTLSPFEGVDVGHVDVVGFAASQRVNLAGGVITGPLFGVMGFLWRRRRARLALLGVAAAFTLEPVARSAVGRLDDQTAVWLAEAALGIALCTYAAVSRRSMSSGSLAGP